MKLVWMAAVLALTTSVAVAGGDPTKESLAKLRVAAKCEDVASPWRPWCVAADWDKGTAVMPKASLIGLSIEIANDGDVGKALVDKVGFAALAVTGDKVTLTEVKPSDQGEAQMVGEAVANLALVFKGKAKTAAVAKDMAGYIQGMKGTYATTKAKAAVTWTGKNPSSLRKVGAFYVIIEVPADGRGVFATILTDAWAARP